MPKIIGGWLLIGWGSLFSLGVVNNVLTGGFSFVYFAALLVFGVAPIISGSVLISRQKKHTTAQQQQSRCALQEKEILRLAQEKGGRLAVPDVVVGTSLSSAEAETVMREMSARGLADMQVTDAGIIVYEFYEIANRHRLEE